MHGEGAGKHDLLCYTRHKALNALLGPISRREEQVKLLGHLRDVWSVRRGGGVEHPWKWIMCRVLVATASSTGCWWSVDELFGTVEELPPPPWRVSLKEILAPRRPGAPGTAFRASALS